MMTLCSDEDFDLLKENLRRLDLPAPTQFLLSMCTINLLRITEKDGNVSFILPEKYECLIHSKHIWRIEKALSNLFKKDILVSMNAVATQ